MAFRGFRFSAGNSEVIMKILFISPRFPYPPTSGADLRIFYLLKEVSKYHDTSLISFITDNDQLKYLQDAEKELCPIYTVQHPLRRYWKNHLRYFFSTVPYYRNVAISQEMSSAIKRLCNENHYDIVQIEFLSMAHFIEDIRCPRIILDMHNVESLLFNRMLKILPFGKEKTLGMFDNLKLEKYETNQIKRFSACLASSDVDREILEKNSSNGNIFTIPNGVQTGFFKSHMFKEEPASILYMGSYSYYPNVDAVLYFSKEILPRIKEMNKDVRFIVVGRNPPPEIMALNGKNGVIVKGFVEDVREYLGRATLFVVPLRSGSGTRLKILEAWAMGKAVVSTSLGTEGLLAKQNKNCLIADDPDSFAERVLDLLGNKRMRNALGRAGRDTVKMYYEWEIIGKQLLKVYSGLYVYGQELEMPT